MAPGVERREELTLTGSSERGDDHYRSAGSAIPVAGAQAHGDDAGRQDDGLP
jgi:hypothetical protein